MELEEDPGRMRVLWIGALALIRSVGHVLRNVDGKSDTLRPHIATTYKSWRTQQSCLIFREFIEKSRNLALKEYKLGIDPGQAISISVFGDDGDAYCETLDQELFRPLTDGPWRGEDARDIYEMAICWWEVQLTVIERATA
jgi:hypothetical protein